MHTAFTLHLSRFRFSSHLPGYCQTTFSALASKVINKRLIQRGRTNAAASVEEPRDTPETAPGSEGQEEGVKRIKTERVQERRKDQMNE